jgi:NADH-quinone oxidoreductase subunit L
MFEQLSHYVAWVPILPLIGAMINGAYSFSGARLVRPIVHWIACGSLFLSFLISAGTFLHVTTLPEEARSLTVTLFPWIKLGSVSADVAFLIDPLSLTMMLVVTGVGFLIHVYSIGYMGHDPGYARYFSYLNLFCFAMLTLVMGENLFMMFIGWEGVGLCSYLLIGYWFTDREKAVAGMKAFIVNRIGDFGFIVGILLLFWTLQAAGQPTVTFTELREAAPLLADKSWLGLPVVTLVCLFFFVGATGKSAQIPLYVWLPDAMAGPTPVSALIHAATMVTAGVYMIGRMSFLYSMSPTALAVVATVGFATAIFAAVIGFAQNDIKKVLAYSTVSQLGYMFGAMGVAAYTAGIFHLVTHAFFKACLFLGSGSVIHAMSGEQDIQKMGGLKNHLPITFKTFFVATLAIAGIFPLAGFFSKDEILWHAFNGMPLLWLIGLAAAAGTAIYMFRLVTLTFFGECRADEETKHHIHESPGTMTVPLILLAFLSIVGGFLGVPESLGHLVGLHESNLIEHWLKPAFVLPVETHKMAPHAVEYLLMALSLGVAVAGCYAGYTLYTRRQDIPAKIVEAAPRLYRFVRNKYYVDELYQLLFVKSLLRLNDFLGKFDLKVIDGLVNLSALVTKITSFFSGWFDRIFVDGAVNFVADATQKGGAILRRTQTGRIQTYLYYAMGGILLVLLYRFL